MNIAANNKTGTWDCLTLPIVQAPDRHYPYTVLQLQFLVVFCTTQALHHGVFKHLGLPPLVSQLFAGFVLNEHSKWGKTGTYQKIHQLIFPNQGDSIWRSIGQLGYTLSLFMIGVKMDLSIMFRTGKKAYAIGILSVVVPIFVGTMVTILLLNTSPTDLNNQASKESIEELKDGVVSSILMPVTYFPVVVVLLGDLNILNSELGRLALSSSLIGELVGMMVNVLITVIQAMGKIYLDAMASDRESQEQSNKAIQQVVTLSGLISVAVFVMRPSMRWMIKRTPIGRPVKEFYVLAIILSMLIGGLITDQGKELLTLGVFIVGATVPDGPPLGATLVDKFDTFFSSILQPFFTTTAVMGADLKSVTLMKDRMFLHRSIVFIVGFATKMITILSCGFSANMKTDDSLALGFLMSSKGMMDIGTILVLTGADIISGKVYAVMIIFVTISAIIAPFAVKHLYNPQRKYGGYQRRSVLHCRFNDELRILGCIYKPDNIPATVNFLKLFCGNEESAPITAYILHLMKLVGKLHPVFVSHDLQKKAASSSCNFSDDVVWAFRCFDHNSKGVASASVFTAISPTKLMHEDICTLALDKVTSLIILPFHRKFRIDGSIDFEDQEQRALNISVLERAPCSVAVLINRGLLTKSNLTTTLNSVSVASSADPPPFAVAVIFLGGRDDREALALAKRMARGSMITVDVVRLVAAHKEENGYDMLDSATLKDLQGNSSFYGENFNYMEKVVKDGSDTAILLQQMVQEYDLVVIGRRYNQDCNQTSGLREWSEISELGIIGDLLAMGENHLCRTSVLVVQQQRQWTLKGSKRL